MSETLLQCKNLTVQLNKKPILNQTHLTVNRGETVCVIGPSGCGKTTLLRTLAGMTPIEEGKIILDGEDITNMKPEKRPVVMMFQQSLLFPHMTVLENVAYGLKLQKVNKYLRKRTSEDVLRQIGMENHMDSLPHQLSGGQQQRVAFARALVTKPKVILFDEPFSSLDSMLRMSLRTWVKRILKDEGMTALFVTHDKEEAMMVGDRIAVMAQGVIRQVGKPFDVYTYPDNIDTASLFSEGVIINSRYFIPNNDLIVSAKSTTAEDEIVIQGSVLAKWFKSGQLFYQIDLPSISQQVTVPGEDGFDVAESVYVRSSYRKQVTLEKF